MPSVKVFNQKGAEAGSIELADSVFAAEYNEALIHQAVVAQRNNARQGTKCTLTRTEVRGGGIKPWRQKGTGRARQGSIRSPQWAGGGVVFAPKPRDFSQKLNKQARRNAICSALSEKLRGDELKIVDEIKIEPKTKQMAQVLSNLKLDKRVLIVVTDADEAVVRAAKNMPGVSTLNSSLINVDDVVANAKCVRTKEAAKKIEEAYKE